MASTDPIHLAPHRLVHSHPRRARRTTLGPGRDPSALQPHEAMQRVPTKCDATPDEELAVSDATAYISLRDQLPPHQQHMTRSPKANDSRIDFIGWLPLPSSSSVWALEAVAIPVTYMVTGLLSSLPQANMEVFPRMLGASDAQLSTVAVVRALPWTFKVAFGLLPDTCPVRGKRFTPYLLLGCSISSLFHLLLAMYSASKSLTVVSFTLLLLGATVGVVMADVMADAIVAHRVLGQKHAQKQLQQEKDAQGGQLQATVYLCRFASEMTGYWLGALLSNERDWGFGVSMSQQFAFLALVPLVSVLPALWYFDERVEEHATIPIKQQFAGIWIMLQRRATWQPVCFLALANALLLHNAAWGNFLKVAYDFDAFQYGALSAVAATVTFVSIFVYRHHILPHFEAPWHHVYFFTGIVVALFSLLNVLLVLRVNEALGLAPFWFAVGDAAVVAFARGFQYLPLAQMFVAVCPERQEGVAFALLTSITNLAHAFANTLSNMLLLLWPVELSDLERDPHDFSGVWKLSILTSVVPLLPMLLLSKQMLPKGPRELDAIRHEMSVRGARVVLALYCCGFLWVIVLSLLAIIAPCHKLVGGHGCS